MKTSLTSVALVATIAFPTSLAAVIFGADLPVALGLDEMLGLFIFALTTLIFATDYAKLPASLNAPSGTHRALLAPPAHANEERRLAA